MLNSPSDLLLDFINVEDPSFSVDASNSWSYSQCQSPVKLEDEGWNALLSGTVAPTSLVILDDDLDGQNEMYIPGGLSQISMSSSSRSPTPEETMYLPSASLPDMTQPTEPTTIVFNPSMTFHMPPTSVGALTPPIVQQSSMPPVHQAPKKKTNATGVATSATPTAGNGNNTNPHPYSISPHNTAALFTRASSVSSNTSSSVQPAKKSRAPPSGPISTRDFIPPDVSGLNKREARLVKNRAAAFLSRQRKREEFEGLEARVEVLESDNARLYREIEAYKSGAAPRSSNNAATGAGSSTGALTAEIAGLRRQLASRDVELSNLHTRIRSLVSAQDQLVIERERAAERDREIAELRSQLAAAEESKRAVVAAPAMKQEVVDSDDSDSDDAQSTVTSRKEMKSAGGVAVMALLFSLSTLLTNNKTGGASTTAKAPVASERVSMRSNMHHRSESLSNGYMYDSGNPFSFESLLSSGPSGSSSFGFDEDSLMASHSALAKPTTSDPFADLFASTPDDSSDENALKKAISGVKSTGPNEFEFDFAMPCASSSSTPLASYYGTPTTQTPSEKRRKIKVCVRSAVPLYPAFGSTDDLDARSQSSSLSGLGKRKRVTVDIKPRRKVSFAKRKLSTSSEEDDDQERWDVSLNEDVTDAEFEDDEDTLMT
ncbi:hypothetical protein FRB94_000714 [Tulasnella sp. JGI-2019a]|nr:hypothetical protein FRB93_003031 [Tulasnella sp. JGI-2019a]KAG9006404.1 hypothetical protein FRB94_000714 [Tulasnella sp. JGI-2019a]